MRRRGADRGSDISFIAGRALAAPRLDDEQPSRLLAGSRLRLGRGLRVFRAARLPLGVAAVTVAALLRGGLFVRLRDQGVGHFGVVFLRPGDALGRREAAAARPAIARAEAAAGATLARKRPGKVFGADRRQRQTDDGNDLAHEGQPRAAAASEVKPEVSQPPRKHGGSSRGCERTACSSRLNVGSTAEGVNGASTNRPRRILATLRARGRRSRRRRTRVRSPERRSSARCPGRRWGPCRSASGPRAAPN